MSKKFSVKIVVLALIFTLVMPVGAFASVAELQDDTTTPGISLAGKYKTDYDDIDFQYSITEEATHEITIETKKTEAELKAAVEAQNIGFALNRDEERTYLDPELYPYPNKGGDISQWLDRDGQQAIQIKEIAVDGSNLKVKIDTFGTEYYYTADKTAENSVKKVYSIDHTNGGKWLDKCGYFDFVASIGDEAVGSVHAKVVPYDAYRTPYELFDEIEALKAYKGNRYVEVGSIGHTSIDGYDTPYVLVAGEKGDVDKWLKYTELSENNPAQVLKDIKAGKYDNLKVPLYVSNCHTNENSAINGIWNLLKN